ncbi:neuromedin U [Alginatibacterium sediminis]|uniref:Neuromedin U n=1 Tax=Alginatibacterium sediminis TaxID=2164068 RepID=A0A420EDH7_9ALTE|nr:neuromedin U [Alginatibacterium sediminis]RKF18704.1 neuromedin U [Alginatibacterium sediminis]
MIKSIGIASLSILSLHASNVVASDDLRSAVQNPISSLVSLPFKFTVDNGAENGDANFLNIQPVYPITYGDWNYVNRLIVPIADAPGNTPGLPGIPNSEPGPRASGLSDINYSLFLSPVEYGSVIWGVGPSITGPTASKDTLGAGKWSAGPTAVALAPQKWGSMGMLGRHLWSFAGDNDRQNVNQTLVEPFLNYNLSDGWFLLTDMVITANWQASSGDQWTVPVGGGVGRVFTIGEQPVNMRLEGYYNTVRPTGAPKWSSSFTVQLLFPK